MKKLTLIILSIITFAVISNTIIESDSSLYLDINTTITPLIENSDEPLIDQYIKTLKITYKDYLDKPIKLQNGDKLYNRCSYNTTLIFYSEKDSLKLESWQRMSCEIVAFFNLKESDSQWIKNNNINKISIINVTTNNKFVYKNEQPEFLKNLLTLYNKNTILK